MARPRRVPSGRVRMSSSSRSSRRSRLPSAASSASASTSSYAICGCCSSTPASACSATRSNSSRAARCRRSSAASTRRPISPPRSSSCIPRATTDLPERRHDDGLTRAPSLGSRRPLVGGNLAVLYGQRHADRVAGIICLCGTGLEWWPGYAEEHERAQRRRLEPAMAQRLRVLHGGPRFACGPPASLRQTGRARSPRVTVAEPAVGDDVGAPPAPGRAAPAGVGGRTR